MGDFVAPSGPPPPKVPQGWKAVWNPEYKEHFFVNIYTKKSQWDKPEIAAYPPDEAPPAGPPVGQDTVKKEIGLERTETAEVKPVGTREASGLGGINTIADARLARELQDQENQKAPATSTTRGAADSYYNDPIAQQQLQQNQTTAPASGAPGGNNNQDRNFLGNLMGQHNPQGQQGGPAQGTPPINGASQGYPPNGYPNQSQPPQGYPPQGYLPQSYPPQGYPPPSYSQQQNYPGQMYNRQPGYPAQGYGQQQGYYGSSGAPAPAAPKPAATATAPVKQPAAPPSKSGLKTAGALAMGAGGGMLGGMLLNHALSDRGSNVSGLDLDDGLGLDEFDNNDDGDNDHYCGSDEYDD